MNRRAELFEQRKIATFMIEEVPVSSPSNTFEDGGVMRNPTISEVRNARALVCRIQIRDMTLDEVKRADEIEVRKRSITGGNGEFERRKREALEDFSRRRVPRVGNHDDSVQ
jgi:hypothetical protein